MAKNLKPRNVIMFAIMALVALVLFNCMTGRKSFYTGAAITGAAANEPAAVDAAPSAEIGACALKNGGTGLASALLPKEVATQESFGEFAPDAILAGQNYLDPRNQVGFPETVGGALRNANQQVRSEPPNPREAVSIFNTSTIAPDQMRPPFEIGAGLA